MPAFERTRLKLKDGHTWRCSPGYKICALAEGALRFDVPREGVSGPGESSLKIYDLAPPEDNCRLEVSLLRHSQIDWSGLRLEQLIRNSIGAGAGRISTFTGSSVPGVKMAWAESSSVEDGREARSRLAIGRGLTPMPS